MDLCCSPQGELQARFLYVVRGPPPSPSRREEGQEGCEVVMMGDGALPASLRLEDPGWQL